MLDPSSRLRKAIIDGNILIVNRLLKRFPDLLDNIDPQNGWSNLHYAAYHDRYEISELLLKLIHNRYQDADYHYKLDTSFSNSSFKRSSENFKPPSYTQISSEEEIKLAFNKDTVIHLACRTNAYKTLQLILSYFNVCIDQRCSNGSTATHICSLHNFQESLRVLLENGAYPNIQDDDGNTPLHLSLQYGHIKCADLLLSYKADDEMLNNAGWKPIDIAYSDQVQIKYLQIKTKPHSTPMHTSFSNSTVNSIASTSRLQSPVGKINLPTIQSRKFSISSSGHSEDEYGDNVGSFDYDSDLHSLGTSGSSKNTRSSSPLVSSSSLAQPQQSNAGSVGIRSSSTQNLQNIPENITNPNNNERRLPRKVPSMTISIPSNPSSTIATQVTPTNTNTPRKQFHPIVTPNSKRSSMSTRTFRSNSLASETNISPNKSIPTSSQQSQSTHPSPHKSSSASTLSSNSSLMSQHHHQQQQQQQQQPQQVPLPRKQSMSSSNGQRPFLKSFSSTSEIPSQQPMPSFMKKSSSRTFSSSSEIDEATSKLNDFKLQNENRVKLGMKLDTMVNKSQDSLVLESPIDKPPTMGATPVATPTLNSLMSPTGLVFGNNKDTYRFPSPSLGGGNGSGVGNPGGTSGMGGGFSYKSKVLSIPIASLKSRRAS